MTVTLQNFPDKGLINHSYERMIRFLFAHIEEPKNILEFGPGYSTCLLSELAPNANIFSYESEKTWFDYHTALFEDIPNIKILPHTKKQKFIKQFDVAFIDGMDRQYCVEQCKKMGIKLAILHDAQNYIKDGYETLWKYTLIDEVETFYRQHNLEALTQVFSDTYNFKQWFKDDNSKGYISKYPDGD